MPSLTVLVPLRAGPMKGVYLSIVPMLTIAVASSMQQQPFGYINILGIPDGYAPIVCDKAGIAHHTQWQQRAAPLK